MAIHEGTSASLPIRAASQKIQSHPLNPLTAGEITYTVNLIKTLYPAETKLRFKQVTLQEPAKAELAPYLDAEAEGRNVENIDRRSFVTYYISNTDKFHEAIVNLTQGKIEKNLRLGPNKHGNGDGEEIIAIEKAVLEDEKVKAEIAKLQLPKGSVVICDPWIYGSDGVEDDRRLYQCFLYLRDTANPTHADSNHYALPLNISPVLSTDDFKVIRIDIMPMGKDNTVKPVSPYIVRPANEYTPEHQDLRTDLKPLQVVQPEGASFKVTPTGETGHKIEWQKWAFRVGFNAREGMIIYDVRYDSRPLFYRLSLSDMCIPYADPRHPFHKKAAFDLGDAGAGSMANNLALGCDCLGSIHYLSAVLPDSTGTPQPAPNVVCIHEQDSGIGWKHTNYRTGRAAVVRHRELVVQSIITVSNYEYILAFHFNQAAGLEYEVRATGILSTQPIDDETTEAGGVPWGTVVHPGVLATHHQHIFSLRIDPMIDGHANTLVYEEAHPMPRSLTTNPHGVGYTTSSTTVTRACALDTVPVLNRTFKIQNPAITNRVSRTPVSYKISPLPPFQPILADSQSFHFRRAQFADHALYVLPYADDELYAAGTYTNQSRGDDGVREWAKRGGSVENTDIVLFVQFGLQHIPRVEDFPVMPVEIVRVGLRPCNFFERNPALDVPPSAQAGNRSVLVNGLGKRVGEGMVNGHVNGNGVNGIGGVNGNENGAVVVEERHRVAGVQVEGVVDASGEVQVECCQR